ncbi:MAG: thiamine biosynthesis protein ThiF, partial [Planctomycetaceae bacterium]|nr:thiamine biosynthesis protein ThiF [Planctomycetaceae bacterium]
MKQDLTARDVRQREIVPPDRLAACPVTVIGVGAVGRQVALQLAAMGAPHLQLVDHDVVEVVNLAAQGYLEEDLGALKVEATARLCKKLNSKIEIDAISKRFGRSMQVNGVLIACVDSIDTRRFIWQVVKDRVNLLVDGRISAETLRVLAVADEASRAHYPTTLFRAEEAYRGACTARSTIYAASAAGAYIVVAVSR